MDLLSCAVNVAIQYIFLLTPFFLLSSFLAFTAGDVAVRRNLAIRTTVAIFVICIILYFFGSFIFFAVGITIDAFRIGAGGLLFLSAAALTRGDAVGAASESSNDISVVPLAMPIAIGPATAGALILMGAGDISLAKRVSDCLGIALAAVFIGVLLLVAGQIERVLGGRGIRILSKLTGLILAAMAAQLVFSGAKSLLH